MARLGNIVTGYLERIQEGPERQARFELAGNRARLGRGIRNNFILPHLTISRDHAEFQFSENNWEIKDVSQNGISINYHRITSNIFVLLENNDIISFVPEGQLDYRFVRQGGTLQEDNQPELGSMSPTVLYSPFPQSPQPSTSAAALSVQSARNNKRPPDDQRLGRGKQIRLEDGGHSVRSEDTHVLSQGQSSPTYSFLDSPGSSLHGGNNNIPTPSAHRQNPRDLRINEYVAKLGLVDAPRESSSSQVRESDGTRDQLEGQLLQVLEDEFNCVICSDVLIDPSVVECGHQFCAHCIQVWITEREQSNAVPNCPTCRVPIRSDRRLVSSTFLDRIYSLLSPAARENRQQILQQRQVEHEDWEVLQVARREAARRDRQDQMAELRRRSQADAAARFHADRVRRYIYNNLLNSMMDDEGDRAGNAAQNPADSTAENRADSAVENGANSSAHNSAENAAHNSTESAAQNRDPGCQISQNSSAALQAIRNANWSCRAASTLGARFPSIGPCPNSRPIHLHNDGSMINVQSTSSRSSQNASGPSSSSAPRPALPPRLPIFHTNPLSRLVLANYIRRRGTCGLTVPGPATERQSGSEVNVRHEQSSGSSSRSDSAAESNDRPTERMPNPTENDAALSRATSEFRSRLLRMPMPQPARASGPSPVIIPGLGRIHVPLPTILPNLSRLSGPSPVIIPGLARSSTLSSVINPGLARSSATSPVIIPGLGRIHVPLPTIPPNLSRLSGPSPVINPGLAGSSATSPVIIPGLARPPSVSSIIDQRVPSPALSIASNSSALSDPFARAGGIVADPLERRSPAAVVVNPLIAIAANYGEPVEIQQEDVQEIQQVQEEEGNVEEEISMELAPPIAEPAVVRVRNVARRRRARPARPNSNHSDEVQMVGSVRRLRSIQRRGDRRQQHLNPSEQRLLHQFMNYLLRPPSSSSRSGAGRQDGADGDEDDDVQIIEDEIQIIYEGQ